MALKRSLRCGTWAQSPPRGLGWEVTSPAEHTHRHHTALFRSGQTCPEAGIKRALPSDILGPSPQGPAPCEQRESMRPAGPYTQHKRDGVPPRNETKAVAMDLVTPDPLEVEDWPGRKSRRTLRHQCPGVPREEASTCAG